MTLYRTLSLCSLFLLALLTTSCCQAPPVGYEQRFTVQRNIVILQKDFLKLLPAQESQKPQVQEEALWISKSAYTKSAEISRINKHILAGWFNNMLVNSNLRDRGLCWHYQHDLFRELRRRKLNYFHLGMTIRDKGRGREHSCVYINAKGKGLPDAIVLDAWAHCGHLKVIPAEDRGKNWTDEPDWERYVGLAFPEGHQYPMRAYIKQDKE
ncbi:MAG: hypothetical protein RR138_01090 [Akkermansia sp.]